MPKATGNYNLQFCNLYYKNHHFTRERIIIFLVIFYRDKFVLNQATFSSGHCEGVEFIGRCVLTAL
jgi:hypothetical protein